MKESHKVTSRLSKNNNLNRKEEGAFPHGTSRRGSLHLNFMARAKITTGNSLLITDMVDENGLASTPYGGGISVNTKINGELWTDQPIKLNESEEHEWSGDVAAGDWNNLYTPEANSGETGYIMSIDKKDDDSYDMAYVKYTEDTGSVTLAVEVASTRVQFQDNSGTIQIANNVNPGAGHWLKAYTRISAGTE